MNYAHKMTRHCIRVPTLLILILSLLVVGQPSLVLAQEPIVLDENKLGNLSNQSGAIYTFQAQTGQTVQITVTALAPNMQPWFVVRNSSGQSVLIAQNTNQSTEISQPLTFAEAGAHQILVFTANSIRGDFVLTISAVEVAPTPTPTFTPTATFTPIPDTPTDTTNGQTPSGQITATRVFDLTATPDALTIVTVLAANNAALITAELIDNTGQIVTSLSSSQAVISLSIPAGTENYTLLIYDTNSPPATIEVRFFLTPIQEFEQESETLPEAGTQPNIIQTEETEDVNEGAVSEETSTAEPDNVPVETEEVTDETVTEEGQDTPLEFTATYTPTFTLTYTPTVPFTVTPSFTPTIPPTYTPTFTPTIAPTNTATFTLTVPPPTAPADARFNSPLTIPLDATTSVTDFVSYPGGDTEDRVNFSVSGMNNNSALSGGRARLIIAVSCFGTGTQNIQFFTGGQTYSCGQTIVDREVTADSDTGSVVITAVAGEATYVQWVLTGTATRVN